MTTTPDAAARAARLALEALEALEAREARDAAFPPSSALRAWRSSRCRSLYTAQLRMPATGADGLAFDWKSGVFTPPSSGGRQTRHKRILTIEDTFSLAAMRLDLTQATRMDYERGSDECARVHCHELGLPLAIRTVQRPAKGFLLYPRRPASSAAFVLAIERSGLRLLTELFAQHRPGGDVSSRGTWPTLRFYADGLGWAGDRRSVRALSWIRQREDLRCRAKTNAQLLDQVVNASLHSRNSQEGDALTACGYAATFDDAVLLQSADPQKRLPLRFALVRDPLERFLAAHNDHGGLSHRCPAGPCPAFPSKLAEVVAEYADRAKRLAALTQPVSMVAEWTPAPARDPFELSGGTDDDGDGRFLVRLMPPRAFVHEQTQAYFLSATDAQGHPIEWDALVRLDRVGVELPPLLRAIFGPPPPAQRAMGAGPRAAFRQFASRFGEHRERNTKHGVNAAQLRDAVLNDTALMCNHCRYAAQDCAGPPCAQTRDGMGQMHIL